MIDAVDRTDAGAFLVRLVRLDPAAVVRLRPTRADPSAGGRVARGEMWAMLPFRVLVMRTLSAAPPADLTVRASDLLASLRDPVQLPPRRDEAWRWPLPPSRGVAVETVPAHELARVAAAASRTLRAAATEGVAGRAVGERMLRDALLDHVPIVVTGANGERVEVPQRMVQAVVRMGFLGRVTSISATTSAGPTAAPTAAATPAPTAEPSAGGEQRTRHPVTHSDSSITITARENTVTVRLAMAWIGLDASYGSAWYRPISPLRLG